MNSSLCFKCALGNISEIDLLNEVILSLGLECDIEILDLYFKKNVSHELFKVCVGIAIFVRTRPPLLLSENEAVLNPDL